MPKIQYCGPHQEVEIPALGLTFPEGTPVEVDADVAKSLLEQVGNFKKAASETKKENDK